MTYVFVFNYKSLIFRIKTFKPCSQVRRGPKKTDGRQTLPQQGSSGFYWQWQLGTKSAFWVLRELSMHSPDQGCRIVSAGSGSMSTVSLQAWNASWTWPYTAIPLREARDKIEVRHIALSLSRGNLMLFSFSLPVSPKLWSQLEILEWMVWIKHQISLIAYTPLRSGLIAWKNIVFNQCECLKADHDHNLPAPKYNH